jgi:hypothetical protein
MAEVQICKVVCTVFSLAQQWFGIAYQDRCIAKGSEIILN